MKHVIYGDSVTRRTALAMSRGIALDIDCALVSTELAWHLRSRAPGWHRKPWDNHICVLRRNADDRLLRELMSVIRSPSIRTLSTLLEVLVPALWLPDRGCPVLKPALSILFPEREKSRVSELKKGRHRPGTAPLLSPLNWSYHFANTVSAVRP